MVNSKDGKDGSSSPKIIVLKADVTNNRVYEFEGLRIIQPRLQDRSGR